MCVCIYIYIYIRQAGQAVRTLVAQIIPGGWVFRGVPVPEWLALPSPARVALLSLALLPQPLVPPRRRHPLCRAEG